MKSPITTPTQLIAETAFLMPIDFLASVLGVLTVPKVSIVNAEINIIQEK